MPAGDKHYYERLHIWFIKLIINILWVIIPISTLVFLVTAGIAIDLRLKGEVEKDEMSRSGNIAVIMLMTLVSAVILLGMLYMFYIFKN